MTEERWQHVVDIVTGVSEFLQDLRVRVPLILIRKWTYTKG